jgi:RsiW-degrading membrane proteinase PrsW (M82 family)
MQQVLLILPIALPVLFWAVYHYHKDRNLPEPLGLLFLTFVLGMLASGISVALYNGLGVVGLRFDASHLADTNILGLFVYAMLAIGPIEEIAKLLPFLLIVVRFRAFDEPIDGIIYASFIALGYAAVENWQYLDYLSVHILFASIWGHWIAQAHLGGRNILLAALAGLGIAAALHGLYDFFAISNPKISLPIAAILIVSIWLWRLKLMGAMDDDATQQR